MSRSSGIRPRVVIAVSIAVAAALHVALVALAPRYAFFGDHVDYVAWGRQAVTRGLVDLYVTPPSAPRAVFYNADGSTRTLTTGSQERLNYTPLAAYVFWATGHAHAFLDRAQVANTIMSRAVFAVPTAVAELVTALGARAVVGLFASPLAAAWAFGLTLLAPPLLVDGPFWGQTEAWVLAPAVWMLWAMARERWLLAGVCWGLALALKPSGLLFGPMWAYAFFFRSPRVRVVLGGALAVLVVATLALPFWLTSGATWVRVTLLQNYVYALHWTTMMAFNIWYVDLLLTERLDSSTSLLGLTRDTWGTILLILGLAVAFWVTRRWELRHESRAALGVVPLATLMTIAAVMLPTRVHSTYGAFVAPFAICNAFLIPATAIAALPLIVAITFQILSWQWGNLLAVHVLPDETSLPPARYAERRALRQRDRPREWTVTLVNLAAGTMLFVITARDGVRRERRRTSTAT
jgi:hypothetical protein